MVNFQFSCGFVRDEAIGPLSNATAGTRLAGDFRAAGIIFQKVAEV
jgi:hypothetical protein